MIFYYGLCLKSVLFMLSLGFIVPMDKWLLRIDVAFEIYGFVWLYPEVGIVLLILGLDLYFYSTLVGCIYFKGAVNGTVPLVWAIGETWYGFLYFSTIFYSSLWSRVEFSFLPDLNVLGFSWFSKSKLKKNLNRCFCEVLCSCIYRLGESFGKSVYEAFSLGTFIILSFGIFLGSDD